ncbi:MAG: cytochrome c1 [Pseudomonadota bacterium]|nr:cytochrome c1 [Pseudomonadota bacterium]
MNRFKASFLALALIVGGAQVAVAQDATEGQPKPDRQSWSFSGVFGKFDAAQLQRGFQVYREVCSNCHRLSIAFRTLANPDGPDFSEEQVKALAASYKVTNDEPNDQGKIFQRPGTPADIFPPPEAFPNDQAAAAALGAPPPDMWLLAKSRKYERGFPWFVFDIFDAYQEVGTDYIYAVLTGYTHKDDPQWNLYFPGHKIAMPNPLQDGAVKYTDGTPGTVQNYAKDISAFLSWAAEPSMVERKKLGFRAIVFLIVLSALMYMVKRRVWADAH